MRALFYTAAPVAAISAIVVTILLVLPNWTPYVATVVVDFARVEAGTHNFLPNCASDAFELRWEVIVYAWLGAVLLVLIGLMLNHTRRLKESADDFYEKYIWWLWLGLIVTTLPGSFIVASMSGVTTITVLLLIALSAMLAFALIGPIHSQLNENINRDVHWIIYSIGVLVMVVYVVLLLSYIIQAIVWGHSVLWSNWLILIGDLAVKIAITIVTGLTWVGVKPIISKRTFVIVVTLLTLLHFLWIPWFFFARTVAFTP